MDNTRLPAAPLWLEAILGTDGHSLPGNVCCRQPEGQDTPTLLLTLLTFLQSKDSPVWAFPASVVTMSPWVWGSCTDWPCWGATWDILRADVGDGISSSLLKPPSHPAGVPSGLRFLLG